MKRRITAISVVTILLGGYLVVAMTNADLTEVVFGKLAFQGMEEGFDVFVRGAPLSGHFDVREGDPAAGGFANEIGLARYHGLTVQIPIPQGADAAAALFAWMQENERAFAPRNGVLTILSADGTELTRLILQNAWPSRITQARVTRVGFRGRLVAECEIQADRVNISREALPR